MALSKQVYIYSVDTSAFYTDIEIRIEKLKYRLRRQANQIKKIDKDDRTEDQKKEYALLNKKMKKVKSLLDYFMKKNDKIRTIRDEYINDRNVISVFESALTRTCGIEQGVLSDYMIVVKTYHYQMLKDLIEDGFYVNGKKYRVFTSSSGQIRTKKTVFIREDVWNKHEKTLTCGLSIDTINAKGGVNVNKYLAYLALTNSATDRFDGIDIDRCIVVDDFETKFTTKVDYIDTKTFEISPHIDMEIEIPHMDGCGIMLPKVNRSPFMVRLPWVKGLLAPMQYNSFVKEKLKENPEASKIVDIYGKEYDIFEDKIEVIFTKSQFKMWKYYDSWDEYKEKYKKYGCHVGVCNEEKYFIKDARINYQMLQTLSDMTDSELKYLAKRLNSDIEGLYTDRNVMLKVFGAVETNNNRNNVQEMLMIYPELLQDEHFKQTLRDLKNKLVKNGRSGKLPINGKYTFIIPDLYAFCEWLFLGIENPDGLLKNGEVFCKLYDNEMELDVLRSPHLFLEHAVRTNKVSDTAKRWFTSKGVYTSVHDPISRILQFDTDGDTALVCADQKLVEIAKRNVKKHNVVPLYYEMAKANSVQLSNNQFYNGMISAYSGGNIGAVSNDITKIWNSEEPNIDAIKFLCALSNFVIDFAKTLYKPEVPKHVKELIKSFTKHKTPYFFKYAKDRQESQVEPINNSVVNRLEYIVKDKQFNWGNVALERFNYKLMMHNKNSVINKEILERYNKEKRKVMHSNLKSSLSDGKGNEYIWKRMRENVVCDDSIYDVVDTLILYLFNNSKRKRSKIAFFECFSDIVLENLKSNITNPLGEYILCDKCGKRVKKKTKNSKVLCCEICAKKINIQKTIENRKNKK